MRASLICRLASYVVGVVFSVAAQAADPTLAPALKAQVQAILQSSKSTGATVLLVDALGVSAAYLHGDARANACHSAGAAGDALVALAAMRLAERNKVDLYASLPKSVAMPGSAACKSKVTLSRLLEHTSGMGTLPSQGNDCAGNRTAYSASGVALAALTLEKTTKLSMSTLIKREVFAPLAMHSSSWSLGASANSVAASCVGASAPAQAGLTTTPHHMASMVQMLLQRGQVDAKTYLPQCAVERMGISVSAASMPGGNTPAAIDHADYGLGLQRFKAGGVSWLGYSGDSYDAQWVWGYSSQTQSGMVIMLLGQDAKALRAIKIAVATHLQRDAEQALVSNR